MANGRQPKRGPKDGRVQIHRIDETTIGEKGVRDFLVAAEQDGKTTEIVLSEYNAWRVFAMLAFMLKVPLPAAVTKRIEM